MAYTAWSVVFGEQPSAAKWNILGTNDASFNDGTGLGDGAVTPAKLLAGTGTDWAWKSWTPTLTSMTLGNGTVVAKYAQVGKTVHYTFKFTLGSTSAMSSNPEFSVPVTINSSYTDFLTIGDTAVFDNSTSTVYISAATPSTTSKIRMFATGAASTHAVLAGISSTIPITWATSDILWSAGTYEAA